MAQQSAEEALLIEKLRRTTEMLEHFTKRNEALTDLLLDIRSHRDADSEVEKVLAFEAILAKALAISL